MGSVTLTASAAYCAEANVEIPQPGSLITKRGPGKFLPPKQHRSKRSVTAKRSGRVYNDRAAQAKRRDNPAITPRSNFDRGDYDEYDENFGQKVCDAFESSIYGHYVRSQKYGIEIANEWKHGHTPESMREQSKVEDEEDKEALGNRELAMKIKERTERQTGDRRRAHQLWKQLQRDALAWKYGEGGYYEKILAQNYAHVVQCVLNASLEFA